MSQGRSKEELWPRLRTGPEKFGRPGLLGGLRKRGYGGIVTPPRNRKSEDGNPPPTAGAPELYPRTTRGVARLPEHTVWYHPPAVILRRDSNPSHSTLESFPCEGEHTMSELVTKSVAQEQPGQKIETRTAAQRV